MRVAVAVDALVAANPNIARRSALEAQMPPGVPQQTADTVPDQADSVLTRPRPGAVVGVDAPAAQLLREGLEPALQIRLRSRFPCRDPAGTLR